MLTSRIWTISFARMANGKFSPLIFRASPNAISSIFRPTCRRTTKARAICARSSTLIDAVGNALKPMVFLSFCARLRLALLGRLRVVPHERLYYQVETLVFGRAVGARVASGANHHRMRQPVAPLEPRYEALLSAFGCPLLPMRYESAELAKIAINCCLVSSISVANTLSEICEKIGADWSEIVPALKLDARIGPYAYLSPGLGIAGGNLERDLATVVALSERHNADSDVVRAWIANSQHRRDWAARTIRNALCRAQTEAKIAVWGLAYKENTHSIKNSPSLATIDRPAETRLRRSRSCRQRRRRVSRAHLKPAPIRLQALRDADALLILTPVAAVQAHTADDVARSDARSHRSRSLSRARAERGQCGRPRLLLPRVALASGGDALMLRHLVAGADRTPPRRCHRCGRIRRRGRLPPPRDEEDRRAAADSRGDRSVGAECRGDASSLSEAGDAVVAAARARRAEISTC